MYHNLWKISNRKTIPTIQAVSFCAILLLKNRREQIGGHDAMKRKIALAAAVVGALVLPLCSCIGGIEGNAQQYLSSRYSGEFTITDAERITNETGPIPVLIPSYH